MNPKISIVVDSKNKAISTLTGMVTVGAKVDVEVRGLVANDIPNWGATDKFTGKSLRFRIVDTMGRDLVRYPLIEKDVAHSLAGDTWTVTTVDSADVFSTSSGCYVECDTDSMRKAFCGVPFNEALEFGVILDSIVDDAEYAVGKIKVRQWASASTEDPKVLPDWRETLDKLNTDLEVVEASKTAAAASATSAASSATSASTSASAASGSASSASYSASSANDNRILAQSAKASAEAAKLAAEVAVTHYPQIGANENWFVWDVVNGVWVDTGHKANGGHDIFKGKVFARPANAKGWYDLLAHLIIEMGGNIQTEGITPGSSPSAITMTATDGVQKMLKIVKSEGEYTTEVV